MMTAENVNNRQNSSLKSKALNGVKWSSISTTVSILTQVIKFSILARLIEKKDFGLFATVNIVMGLADQFVEAGMGSAIISKQNPSKYELGTAYFINVFLGLVFFVIVFFCSELIANFYNEPQLISLLKTTSIIFLLQPFGRQYQILLQKEMFFNLLGLINIISSITSLIVATLFAWNKFGVYSMIYSQIILIILQTLSYLIIGIKKFGFHFCFSWNDAKYFIDFGLYQLGSNILNYINKQLDSVLIGKLLGQESLGLFFMAKQLAMRPTTIINNIINQISLPLLAKLQNDSTRLKRAFLTIVHSSAFLSFVIYFLLIIFANEISSIFLGKNWDDSIILIKIFSLFYMIRIIDASASSLALPLGKPNIVFYWNIYAILITIPIIIYSSKFGAIGIASFMVIEQLCNSFIYWFFVNRNLCKHSFYEYYNNILKFLLQSFALFLMAYFAGNIVYKICLSIIGLSIYIVINKKYIKELFRK